MADDEDEFIEELHKYLGEVDEIAQLVLNAHFEIESALDDVLTLAAAHPEHLEGIRLSFTERVQIARALTPESDNHPEWHVILALNALRNEIAHRGKGKKRDHKIKELRGTMLNPVRPKLDEAIKNASEERLIAYAAAMGSGFLIALLDEIRKARGLPIDENE